jgi:DNA-binding PadR family transcriptional regulator
MTLMPLKPLVFEILLALVERPRHGWDLVADVEQRLGGEPLLPGNFYRTLRRMLTDGLLEETDPPVGADDAPPPSERRRYFQLTRSGESLARVEARRLAALVADRRTRRLLKAR